MTKKTYTLQPTYTPVGTGRKEPSSPRGASSPRGTSSPKGASASSKPLDAAAVRAENEDDDGYDPYSDRVEAQPFFEKDPWW